MAPSCDHDGSAQELRLGRIRRLSCETCNRRTDGLGSTRSVGLAAAETSAAYQNAASCGQRSCKNPISTSRGSALHRAYAVTVESDIPKLRAGIRSASKIASLNDFRL